MIRYRRTILALWFADVLSVTGQVSDVNECITSYQWSINPLRQTPCLVAAGLESACGTPTSVNSIPPDNHYLGPTSTQAAINHCLCSSVTYSIISACGGCQNRTFIDWPTWNQNCKTVWLTTFPVAIPNYISVPNWAYLNLSLTNNTFSEVAAQQNATNIPFSTSSSVSTTSASVLMSSSTSSSSTLTPSSSASSRKSQSNAGAIAGGVVGGLVLLAGIALAALWFFLRKRRNAIQTDITFDSQALVAGPSMSSRTTHGLSPVSLPSPVSFPSQHRYTSDMSAFFGSPLTTSGVVTSIPSGRMSVESVSLSVAQLGGGPPIHSIGVYAGTPEI